MRLLTFTSGQAPRLGLLDRDGQEVIDISAAARALGIRGLPETMLQLIEDGESALASVAGLLDRELPASCLHPLVDVKVRAPLERPRKNVYCVGLNYAAHNTEFQGTQSALPEHPIFFSKPPTSVIGPDEPVHSRPDITAELDYEAELGVVIGRRGRDIRRDEVPAHIFGFTCINDITARDLQRRHKQWFIGKSLDGFCPIGPFILTRDDCAWPPALHMTSRVNGELRQSVNTAELLFDIASLIVTLSAGHTLEPGDILATGTPSGVGMSFKPPRFMSGGDVVEVEIERIGVLRNYIM